MFDIVLFEPEIPPNTGNAVRLAAITGTRLHLVRPLGFSLKNKELRRAGLDYHELASVTLHLDWSACAKHFSGRRLFALSTRGSRRYDAPRYQAGDVFVFGPETRGLPDPLLATFAAENRIRLPMQGPARSLNLANAVAVVVYEAWRQLEFAGGS
ncbi:MAG: tRNA (cytidine(34)-2'-O)-methyltransferase [Betaproteobacteria bacterium]|nr:tRNA (cytidine(34)-2'-O)-methyltransferase [Betaproteobacteria bacterium]